MSEAKEKESWPYEIITEEQLRDLQDGKLVASDAGATISGINESNILQFLLELAVAVALGALDAIKFCVGIKAAMISADQAAAYLPEAVWMIWTQHEGSEDHQKRLVELARHLFEVEKLVPRGRWTEILEPQTVVELGFVPTEQIQKNRINKVNTKLHYAQRKYNLLRECSEGYSKLLNLLLQQGSLGVTDDNWQDIDKEMKAIMGAFDLDPFRVLDILMDAFINQTRTVAFTSLTANFSSAMIQNNLGNRFQQAKKEGILAPKQMCCVAAGLVKCRQVSVEAILGHCHPPTADLRTLATHARQQFAEAIKKIGVISLGTNTAGKSENARKDSMKPFIAANMEIDAHKLLKAANSGLLTTCQHLPLLEGLLVVDTMRNAKSLIDHLEALGIVPMHFENVAKALCTRISKLVGPLMHNLFPGGIRQKSVLDEQVPTTRPLEFPEPMWELLEITDIYIFHDQKLFCQICKLIRHTIKYNLHHLKAGSPSASRQDLEQAEEYLVGTLMPASTLFGPDASIVSEIWAILSLYPFAERTAFYQAWQDALEENLLTKAQSKMAAIEVKKILRRLHVAGNETKKSDHSKQFQRLLTKLVHIGPFSTLNALLVQVESYANLTEPILEALKQLTPMAFDILLHMFLTRINKDTRQRIKNDGVNAADWIKALSGMIAGTCKRYFTQLNLHALCECLVEKLRTYKTHELLILSDLVRSMSNVEAVSNISAAQVEACAGGPVLRTEVIYYALQKSTRHTTKAANALANALLQSCASPKGTDNLLVLIYNIVQALEKTSLESSPIPAVSQVKFLAQRYDEARLLFLQMFDFLRTTLSAEQYAKSTPSLSELVSKHDMSPQSALIVHGPLLSKVSIPLTPSDEEGEIAEKPSPAAQTPEEAAKAAEASKEAERLAKERKIWQEHVDQVRDIFDEETWETGLLPEIVLAFWTLDYSDIHFPEARYKKEETTLLNTIKLKEQQARDARHNTEMARRQTEDNRRRGIDEVVHADQFDFAGNEKEVARLKEAVRKLPIEATKQAKHVKETTQRLNTLKELMAQKSRGSGREILDYCVIPRLVLSAEDAMYSAAFFEKLHTLDVVGFGTAHLLATVYTRLMPLLVVATDFEALNIGTFLTAIFQMALKWKDPKTFKEQCVGKYGFRVKFTGSESIQQKDYVQILRRIEAICMRECMAHLESGDYSRMKNTLQVLSAVIKYFPSNATNAIKLRDIANEIVEKAKTKEEKRSDIHQRANNYHLLILAQFKSKRFASQGSSNASKPGASAAAKTKQNGIAASKPAAPAATRPTAVSTPADPVPARKPRAAVDVGEEPAAEPKPDIAKAADAVRSRSIDAAAKRRRDTDDAEKLESRAKRLKDSPQAQKEIKAAPHAKDPQPSKAPVKPKAAQKPAEATQSEARKPAAADNTSLKTEANGSRKRPRESSEQTKVEPSAEKTSKKDFQLRADAPEFKPKPAGAAEPENNRVEANTSTSKRKTEERLQESKANEKEQAKAAAVAKAESKAEQEALRKSALDMHSKIAAQQSSPEARKPTSKAPSIAKKDSAAPAERESRRADHSEARPAKRQAPSRQEPPESQPTRQEPAKDVQTGPSEPESSAQAGASRPSSPEGKLMSREVPQAAQASPPAADVTKRQATAPGSASRRPTRSLFGSALGEIQPDQKRQARTKIAFEPPAAMATRQMPTQRSSPPPTAAASSPPSKTSPLRKKKAEDPPEESPTPKRTRKSRREDDTPSEVEPPSKRRSDKTKDHARYSHSSDEEPPKHAKSSKDKKKDKKAKKEKKDKKSKRR